jgi:hypothetical protein
MKTITTERFVAFDGKDFPTAHECRRHERDNFAAMFVGLTREMVDSAFDLTDADLAKAFETAGSRVGALRRAQSKTPPAPPGHPAEDDATAA